MVSWKADQMVLWKAGLMVLLEGWSEGEELWAPGGLIRRESWKVGLMVPWRAGQREKNWVS